MFVIGYPTQSMVSVLRKHINVGSILGGMLIGYLTIVGDLLDAVGSSTGILLALNNLY